MPGPSFADCMEQGDAHHAVAEAVTGDKHPDASMRKVSARRDRGRHAASVILIGITAGCASFSAYSVGQLVNQAYVQQDCPGIVWLETLTVVLFTAKGVSSYGNILILSRISNRIIGDNQRKVFDKLLNESIGFIKARHSSEFIARISAGAAAASSVLNMLITAA